MTTSAITIAALVAHLQTMDQTLPVYRINSTGKIVPVTEGNIANRLGLAEIVQSRTDENWFLDKRTVDHLQWPEENIKAVFPALIVG